MRSLSTAQGIELDNLASLYGVVRKRVGEPDTEDDIDLRRRAQEAFHAHIQLWTGTVAPIVETLAKVDIWGEFAKLKLPAINGSDVKVTVNGQAIKPIEYIQVSINLDDLDPKCECGSEKAGVAGHSHWCAKYEV